MECSFPNRSKSLKRIHSTIVESSNGVAASTCRTSPLKNSTTPFLESENTKSTKFTLRRTSSLGCNEAAVVKYRSTLNLENLPNILDPTRTKRAVSSPAVANNSQTLSAVSNVSSSLGTEDTNVELNWIKNICNGSKFLHRDGILSRKDTNCTTKLTSVFRVEEERIIKEANDKIERLNAILLNMDK